MKYKAVIAGASGMVGRLLLDVLLAQHEYDEVLILVRKVLPVQHPKLTQQVVDFARLAEYAGLINGHAVFCCLGSTRKKTPDLSVYRNIDHDYPLELARIAHENHVGQYHFVSAIGANAASSNFYTKMKGETEDDIKHAGLKCLHIYQPSLLTGRRAERRFAERIFMGLMKAINPLLIGRLKKYRSIPAADVAMAMYKNSLLTRDGIFVHPSDKIKELT